jgi:hypothetical protein
LALFELASIVRPKFLTPVTNRFIGDGDAAFGKQLFDFAEAEAEAMVQPHGVADNFRGKTVTLVTGCCGFHGAQSAKSELT